MRYRVSGHEHERVSADKTAGFLPLVVTFLHSVQMRNFVMDASCQYRVK